MDSFKIVVLGEASVGKTSLTKRFCSEQFPLVVKSTINTECVQKIIEVKGERIKLNIWDTAGQERYRALAPNYYRGASGAIIAYDITDRQSFERMTSWVQELHLHADQNIAIVIVGNKIDLEAQREVQDRKAEEFASSQQLAHFNTSAKLGSGVQSCFEGLAVAMMQNRRISQRQSRNTSLLGEVEQVSHQKKGCCQ